MSAIAAVFGHAQLLGRDGALRALLAGLEQRLRAQEAADVVGAEGGVGALGHGVSSGWGGDHIADIKSGVGYIASDKTGVNPQSIG